VGIVDVDTGRWVQSPIVARAYEANVMNVAYAANGATIAGSSDAGQVNLFNSQSLPLLGSVAPDGPQLVTVEFLPDRHTRHHFCQLPLLHLGYPSGALDWLRLRGGWPVSTAREN
jgi:hypothetical protein